MQLLSATMLFANEKAQTKLGTSSDTNRVPNIRAGIVAPSPIAMATISAAAASTKTSPAQLDQTYLD